MKRTTTVYTCDACGTETARRDLTTATLERRAYGASYRNATTCELDLCPACLGKLETHLVETGLLSAGIE